MATKRFVYLTYLDAIELHFDVIRFYGEARIGIFDRNLIESALARPKHAASHENADIIRQAATLCFGFIENHPWSGGNKRTATHITKVFLKINGYDLKHELPEIIEMVLAIESDEWKIDEIENWLRERTKKTDNI